MRGTYIPFVETADLSTVPAPYKIPQADATGVLDPAWFVITPPVGGTRLYGVTGSPLPNLSSSVRALGYDPAEDQVFQWNGSRWITIA